MAAALEISTFQYSYNEFQIAGSRRKRRGKGLASAPTPRELYDRSSQELAFGSWFEECHQLIQEARGTTSAPSPHVICLGLGCPASSSIACTQLAFLLRTCDVLSIDRSQASAYDPAFTAEDVNLLTELGVSCMGDNKRGEYPIDMPTVLFMPHCDMHLYENLLRANWSRDRLPCLLLVCNLFSDYLVSNSSQRLAARFPCLARLTPYLIARPLPADAPHPHAFTSTAIQYVTPEALPADADQAFWELPPAAPTAGGAPAQGCLL